jgi:hypothetical protein
VPAGVSGAPSAGPNLPDVGDRRRKRPTGWLVVLGIAAALGAYRQRRLAAAEAEQPIPPRAG